MRGAEGEQRPRVRVGLVGAGRWGRRYLDTLPAVDGLELVGAADLDAGVRDDLAMRLGLDRACSSLEELRALGVEAVIVATPSGAHAELTLRALDLGLHVLVEKPMTTTLRDARRLEARTRATQQQVLVGHLALHQPAFEALVAHRPTVLGTLASTAHVRTSSGASHSEESALTALAPHDLAVAMRLHGSPILAVRVTAASDALDHVSAEARFAGDAKAMFEWSRRANDPVRSLVASGTAATATLDERTQTVLLTHATSAPASSSAAARLDVPAASEPALARQCRHFARVVRGETPALASVADGLACVRAVDALERSVAAGGEWIELDPSLSAAEAWP